VATFDKLIQKKKGSCKMPVIKREKIATEETEATKDTKEKDETKDTERAKENNFEKKEHLDSVDLKKFTLDDFEVIDIKNSNNPRVQNVVLSIVNSNKNGKRIEVSKSLVSQITDDTIPRVSIAVNKDGVAIIPSIDSNYKLKSSGNKFVLYSTELVREVTKRFNLDFCNCVCQSFTDFEIFEYELQKVVFVPINRSLISPKNIANMKEDVVEIDDPKTKEEK
jgi:hypothetical protein